MQPTQNNPALITIDVQDGFHDAFWGKRNNPDCEANIEKLLTFWRVQGWPIIHVQHASLEADSPLRPDQAGFKLMEFMRPENNEKIILKNVNSAFIGTNLESFLKENQISSLTAFPQAVECRLI
jgi:nicotinamidase-related amidase